MLHVALLVAGLLAAAALVHSADVLAAEKCRSLHHQDVDEQGTQYLNQECQLNCVIHGTLNTHFLSEQEKCPADKTGVSNIESTERG